MGKRKRSKKRWHGVVVSTSGRKNITLTTAEANRGAKRNRKLRKKK